MSPSNAPHGASFAVGQDFPECPGGGGWSSIEEDVGDALRLQRILDIIRREGILLSTRGDWYYVSDVESGYVIRNAGAAPMECPCRQEHDATNACDHLWAIRAIRGEFFPRKDSLHESRRVSQDDL